MARTEYGTTWWGEQWLNALTHIDYANRIPRGKTYANTGKVKSFRLDFEQHAIRCHTTFRHPFNLSWSGKTCDIRRSSKTTS